MCRDANWSFHHLNGTALAICGVAMQKLRNVRAPDLLVVCVCRQKHAPCEFSRRNQPDWVEIEMKIFGLMTKCIMCSTCRRLGVGGGAGLGRGNGTRNSHCSNLKPIWR